MKTVPLIISIILIFNSYSFAVDIDISPKDPRWKQLGEAYGFIIGQQVLLEMIEKKYSDLSIEAKKTNHMFNFTVFGESLKGIEEELSIQLGDKYPELKQKISSQVRESFVQNQFTKEQAIAFLAEVKLRGKGELPDSIRSTLLSAHPRYSQNPGLELVEGWKQTFRTKGHQKAKGVDFSISFPMSWYKREGNRPNIVQIFRNQAGHGQIVCNIMVKNLDFPPGYNPTNDDLRDLFQPNELKDMIPDSSTLIDAKSITLEGIPGGMIISDQSIQRLDLTLATRMTQFITIYENLMICIQFIVAKMPNSDESLEYLHKKYLPTYLVVANTFVLNDKYKLK